MAKKDVVAWSDIMSECGNYRDGFVAVYRRFEGLPTDEKDSKGRTIKVTAKSFAEHVGINPRTFQRWCDSASHPPKPRRPQDLKRDVTRAARSAPDSVVKGIMDAPQQTRDEIYHQLKLERAGVDTSESNRKAAVARAHEATQPIRQAIASAGLTLCESALREAAEHLRDAIAEGACNEESMAPITAAFDEFALTMAEARLTIS